jgi:hypothetical protein
LPIATLRDRTEHFAGGFFDCVVFGPALANVIRGREELDAKVPCANEVAAGSGEGRIRNHPVLSSTGNGNRGEAGDSKSTAGSEGGRECSGDAVPP